MNALSHSSSIWRSAGGMLWRRKLNRFCLLLIALFTLTALYGEGVYWFYRMQDQTPAYQKINMEQRYEAPSPSHIFGTDNLGRDVFSRVVQGSRIAFQVGIITSCIAIPIGVVLGCIGGYFGGRTDALIVWLYSSVASMPGLLFILAISIAVGKGLPGIYCGIGLTTWVGICRLIRAEVIKHKNRAYVRAARALGYSHARILFFHILPNVSHIVIIVFSLRFPAAVATEIFISFLGIGVQNEPSWGIMINNARLRLWQGIWWEMTFVTLSIFLLVLAFNVIGDALRDVFDPRLRGEQSA